jgi:hypothetical protein
MRRILLCAAVFFFVAGNAFPQTVGFDLQTFIKEAGVSYKGDFILDAGLDVWEKILDNPYLVGKLWDAYGFRPRYEVKKKDAGVHVFDPSGLEGDVTPIRTAHQGRVFYGAGRINHWAIPIDAAGRALFIFSYRADQGRIRGRVEIYIAGDCDFTSFLLKVGAFVMRWFIEDRFRNNLHDMQKILSDITKEPDRIRGRLKEEDLREFNRLFPSTPSRT